MPGLLQDKKLLNDHLPWLSALREKGREAFALMGLPSAKTEAWKYTKIRNFNTDDFVMPELEGASAAECCCDDCECGCDCGCDCDCDCQHHDSLPFPAYALYFENGRFVPHHPDLPRGVEVMTLMEATAFDPDAKSHLGRLVELENYPLAALNTAYLEEGLFIRIERDVELDKPLLIINHTSTAAPSLFYNLRHLIIVESGAKAELLETYTYSGEPKSRYLVNVVNEIFVERHATFKHYKLQDEAFKAGHIALSRVRVKEHGCYKNFCLQKGADLGRNEVVIDLVEQAAITEVDAAYKMSGWATLDTTTDIRHLTPQTISSQLVKGVVDGDARGVFQGRIHIARNAVQTQGNQLHRALLLSDRAEIDVKPELEIFADDVKCSHGAASGELDEEQLFYMRSRGIDANEARQMLVEAFLDDVLLQIDHETIRDWFKRQLQNKPTDAILNSNCS